MTPTAAHFALSARELTQVAITVGIALVAALAIHAAAFALLVRLTRLAQNPDGDDLLTRLRQPARWSLVAVAFSVAAERDPIFATYWIPAAKFLLPALLGWVAFALVNAIAALINRRADDDPDQFAVRSRRTRVAILSRTAGAIIVVVTVALMLFNIPAVRSIGVTLMASAGLAGLAVGAAAQPALKSLIAGIQMAVTEPIRIGDLVLVDNQTGRIEEIRMTYVVLRAGDERRIIVPSTRFFDTTFQNWSRAAGGLIGSVMIPIRPGNAIEPIRAAYLERLAAQADWDKRTGSLAVDAVHVGSVDLKLAMSAANTAALDRLRAALREAMLEWLRDTMPEALCTET